MFVISGDGCLDDVRKLMVTCVLDDDNDDDDICVCAGNLCLEDRYGLPTECDLVAFITVTWRLGGGATLHCNGCCVAIVLLLSSLSVFDPLSMVRSVDDDVSTTCDDGYGARSQ